MAGLAAAGTGLLTACNDNDEPRWMESVKIEAVDGWTRAPRGTELKLRVQAEGETGRWTARWTVDGTEVQGDSILTLREENVGYHEVAVRLSSETAEGEARLTVEVHEPFKYGTLVLNEGTSGKPGTLVFIDERGNVTPDAYGEANGGKQLGSVTQDLFTSEDGQMYIVSQNGGNDGGFLTVLDAETLVEERAYQDELAEHLSWPTSVAATGADEIYIRDGEGVKRFVPSTGHVTLVPGTEGATNRPMTVAAGKLFAAAGTSILAIQGETVTATLDLPAKITGIIKGDAETLWACSTDGTIARVDAATLSAEKKQVAPEAVNNLGTGWGHHMPNITAKGDTLYLSSTSTWTLYRYIFSTGETTLLVDDLRTAIGTQSSYPSVYNTAAVHPLTGQVYINVIEAYTAHPANHLAVFNCDQTPARLARDYQGYTVCPAGIFFTETYRNGEERP